MTCLSLVEYTLLAFSSLFAIIDPVAVVPLFLTITPADTPAIRVKMARVACALAAGVLLLFVFAGKWIFRLLGLTLPAFQIAGSVVLMMIAVDMLQARRPQVKETPEDTADGADMTDIAATPLAVPMLAGPGAISTSLILWQQADTPAKEIALCLVIVTVCTASFLILRLSAHGARWISPVAMRIGTRLMGLLLAAISVQFVLDALRMLGVKLAD